MNKLLKLAILLKRSGFHKESSDAIGLSSVEHPDWKDEWEEPKDYSPEDIAPNGLMSSDEGSAEKKMNDILSGLGITVITGESGRPLGSGAHGTVYRCIYRGKPCVVKLQYYPAYETMEYGQDVPRFNKLMGMWDSVPEFVRKHIPHVYLAEEGSFALKTYGYKLYQSEHTLGTRDIERFRVGDLDFPFKYQIIVMEELKKLPRKLQYSIEGSGKFDEKETGWIWEEELDNFYPKIWSELVKHNIIPPSRGELSKIIESVSNTDIGKRYYIEPISIRIKGLIINKIQERFSSLNQENIDLYNKLASIIDDFSASIFTSIPRWNGNGQGQNYIPKDVEPFWNAIRWLRENGMDAGDIKGDNIMVDSSGVLKIADLGCL
jgi:serine/threonine protein kinase